MVKTSIGFGVALIALGIGGYLGTGARSTTALIPAAVGLVLVVLGVLGRKPRARMHAMHGAALAALVGLGGSVTGLGQTAKLLMGEAVARPAAAITRAVMAVLCLAFLVLAGRSFVAARLARRASPPDARG